MGVKKLKIIHFSMVEIIIIFLKKLFILFIGIDWNNIRNSNAPIIPHLYIKEPTNFLDQKFFKEDEKINPFFDDNDKKKVNFFIFKIFKIFFLIEFS